MLCVVSKKSSWATAMNSSELDAKNGNLNGKGFHSTKIVVLDCKLNKIYVETESGAKYTITVALPDRRDKTWRNACDHAEELTLRLANEATEAEASQSYKSAYGQAWD